MPCSDHRDNECNTFAEDALRDRVNELTAISCALVNEIMRQPEGTHMIREAESRGKIDIMTFVLAHQAADQERIRDMIDKMSEDERELMATLLEERNV